MVSIQHGLQLWKTIPNPPTEKIPWFAQCEESCRNDIELAFGVLQQRFPIVRYPTLTWLESQIWWVINCYVIVQNIIVAHRWVLNDNTFDHQDPLEQFDH
jgi:hypothetical protein